MTDFKKNKDLVFEQVAQATQQANRSKESVNIIAVTKYVDSGVAARLIDTGIEHIVKIESICFLINMKP